MVNTNTESLVQSLRGNFIVAKALYIAYNYLDNVTDVASRQDSDIADMLTILEESFPGFLSTFKECEQRGIQI
tara:strand:+ start:398 stop:616 length:219 start_codon:yes stop_codon:yes gene_type:complete